MADYTTVAKVRGSIGSTVASQDDSVLSRLITAVSRLINNVCNRPDGFVALDVAIPRLYAGGATRVLRIDECVAVTLVESKSISSDSSFTTWAASGWLAFAGAEDYPNFNKTPYTGLMASHAGGYSLFPNGELTDGIKLPTVRVTAKWGYSVNVPEDIEQAVIIQISRLFQRGKSAFQTAVANGDFGMLTYSDIDPDVEMILKRGRYIRPRV